MRYALYLGGRMRIRRNMNGIILDVVVVVVAVLLIIFGIWRGFYKMIYGLISNIAALVIAIMLVSTVSGLIINKTNLDEALYSSLDNTISQNMDSLGLDVKNVDITFKADGTVTIVHNISDTEAKNYDSIAEYFADKTQGSMFSAFASTVDSMINNQSTVRIINPTLTTDEPTDVTKTLGFVTTTAAVVYLVMAIVFVALWIVCYILVRLLMMLVKKIVNGTYLGHFFDKVLGFVAGAAIAMLLIWGVLTVIIALDTAATPWITPAINLIDSSVLTKFLYNNNYLYIFISKVTNLQQLMADFMGKFNFS